MAEIENPILGKISALSLPGGHESEHEVAERLSKETEEKDPSSIEQYPDWVIIDDMKLDVNKKGEQAEDKA